MTTAARPTFHPAVGGEDQGFFRMKEGTRQISVKDMPGHTRLKMRKMAVEKSREELKAELEDKERAKKEGKKEDNEVKAATTKEKNAGKKKTSKEKKEDKAEKAAPKDKAAVPNKNGATGENTAGSERAAFKTSLVTILQENGGKCLISKLGKQCRKPDSIKQKLMAFLKENDEFMVKVSTDGENEVSLVEAATSTE